MPKTNQQTTKSKISSLCIMQFNIFDSSQHHPTQNHPNNPQNHPGNIHLTLTVKAGMPSMVPMSSAPISRVPPAIDDDTIKSPIFIVQ